MAIDCPYCGNAPQLITGKELYQHRPDLADKKFWKCFTCGAYVGCHPGSERPLGTLANAADRQWRSMAHQEFDQIWKSGEMLRSQAYRWLAEQVGVTVVHIGKSNQEMCKRIVSICINRKGQ